jgi:septal ring factor EnvC (AmiA/AmiB activator)
MKTWIFIGILIALLSSGAYYYYTTTQNRMAAYISNIAALEANVATIKNANAQNVQTIDDLQSAYQRVQEDFSRVQSEFQIIRSQNNELRARLSRHELDVLAAARPGLVEPRINNATANAMRCFELMSGAPLNERERSATTAREANSECPWLFEELRQ